MRRHISILLLTVVAAALVGIAAAGTNPNDGYEFVRVTPLGVDGGVWGINDRMEMVGYYNDRAFFYSNGKFRFIKYPGRSFTDARGINNFGQVVGGYTIVPAPPECGQFSSQGFVWTDGKFADLQFPGSCETVPRAINNRGMIVGTVRLRGSDNYVGFIYQNKSFRQAPLPSPTASFVDFVGVNDEGVVVGYYYDDEGVGQFTYQNGVYKLFSIRNVQYANLRAIDQRGSLVGFINGDTKDVGFVIRHNRPTILDYKNGLGTQLYAINKWGVVAGRSWTEDPATGAQTTFGIVAVPARQGQH